MLVRILFTLVTLTATGLLLVAFVWAGEAIDALESTTRPARAAEPSTAQPAREAKPARVLPTRVKPAQPSQPQPSPPRWVS